MRAEPFGPKRVIAGRPRERGAAYGKLFKDGIARFLDREIYAVANKSVSKAEMLRYAGACGKVVAEACPVVHEELGGVAEGSGLTFEEVVLVTLHEELSRGEVLPKVPHCTAVGVGPPDAAGRQTLVGQTWDWMETVAGLSSVVEWRTGSGPDVLAYGFPGLWAGAGLNSAGVALCWTSAGFEYYKPTGGKPTGGVRVGVPSYALIAHLLYQESLDAVAEEVARDRHAGWFTFVLGDATGRLLSVEGSPKRVRAEWAKGRLVRIDFGTRALTDTPAGSPVPRHPRCRVTDDHLAAAAGKVDAARLRTLFADPGCGVSVGRPTIDLMVFDCAARVAHLSRGPRYGVDWREYTFGDPK
ncbi:MAG: hypothetical protein C0501_01290 [Isosphaera sp.]|nr:hypothetical protein [Isosphaera sp.]